jgi:hypothetical protein
MFISSANGSGGFLSIYPLQRSREALPGPHGETAGKTWSGSANGTLTRSAITQVAELDTHLQTDFQQGRTPDSGILDPKPPKSQGGKGQDGSDPAGLDTKVERALVNFTFGVTADGGKSGQTALQAFLNSLPEGARQKWESFVNGEIVSAPVTPQQAASQVAQLALGDYASPDSSQDNRTARQQFADQVKPAIDKGFESAAKTVGAVSDSVQQTLQQIQSRVLDHLHSFVGVDLTA